MTRLGIIVNPFSGRDVRRVAARASASGHQEKQQQVTRLVLGALSQGVDEVFLAHDPFRVSERAVANLPQRKQVTILKFPLTHSAADTESMARLFWEAGCRVFVVLGGDGTSRIVALTLPDATLLPLSTGTNNVFPYRLEASVAGLAAGLIATGRLDPE
ncbi:MAG: diacylglycerol kinase family protein, partial [Pseudomonadales bacterium]